MKYLCVFPDRYEHGETVVYLVQGQTYAESQLPEASERQRLVGAGRLLEQLEDSGVNVDTSKKKRSVSDA